MTPSKTRRFRTPAARSALAAGLIAALTACGGGTDDTQQDGKLYYGFYQEDSANNPEDPMPGTLIVRLPPEAGRFQGQMPFSYDGCKGGTDIGTIDGQRSALGMDGQWSGVVDSVSVGGGYVGTYDAALDEFAGTYTNAGGKVHVSGTTDCSYDIAAHGTWRLYGGTVTTPSSFVVASSGGTSPQWSWPSLGGTLFYLVRVFDQACLEESVTSHDCMMGEGQTPLNRIQYPAEFPGAKALKSGGSYLVAVHAVNPADWRQVGFTTRIDTP